MAVSDQFALVRLGDGSHTVRDLETGETFHPVIGPMAEARAIHIGPLYLPGRLPPDEPFLLWDVGLGAAANAVALIEALGEIGRPFRCEMISFERTLAPLHFALENARTLVYPQPWIGELGALAAHGEAMLHFPRGGRLHWRLALGDFTKVAGQPAPDAVIYDPYSPVKNPAMWSLAHFTRLRGLMTRPALLTSYTRSTAARVTLLLAGFSVGIGRATGEKEETTLAATSVDLLENPLPAAWLRRVRASTSARPLGGGDPGPISAGDLQRLEEHPQFG